MMNFGIDLNENSRMDSKIKKIGKTSNKAKGELENYLLKNMDDEAVLEMSIEDYLKRIGYKIPENVDYKHKYKKNISESIQELIVGKLKSKYYYK